MLAALTRETGLLLGIALVSDRLLQRDWRRAAWFASSAIPAVVWYGYVAWELPHEGSYPSGIPVWGLISRLLLFRTYPDPRLQLLLRVTDVLAVLGLAISIIVAARWLLQRRLGPVSLCVALFAVLGLTLDGQDYMIDSMSFGRLVSPLLLWVMIEAVSRQTWAAIAPPMMISLSVGLVFANPVLTILKTMLGR
jgi:hypothetical protein